MQTFYHGSCSKNGVDYVSNVVNFDSHPPKLITSAFETAQPSKYVQT